MADRQDYTVTERAGRRVAGRVTSVGATLSLTPDEAEHELREGTLVAKGRQVPKAFEKSPQADRSRAEAAAMKPAGPAPDGPSTAS